MSATPALTSKDLISQAHSRALVPAGNASLRYRDPRQNLALMAAEYLRYLLRRKRRPNTIVNYAEHLKRFILWLNARDVLVTAAISPDHLRAYGEEWVEHERAGEYKASTCNNHLTPLRGFLNWLIAEGLVLAQTPERMPWVTPSRVDQFLADVPDTARPTRKQRALSDAEVRRLIAAIESPRDLALFDLLAGSGMRVTECRMLRAGDVDLRPDGALVVHILHAKGGKPRDVVVSAEVGAALRAWATSQDLRLGDARDERYLWTAERPHKGRAGEPLTRIRIYQMLQTYAKKAGIRRKLSPHNLRHTLATAMYRGTKDAVLVAERLGHSGLNYVQTYVKEVDSETQEPFEPNWKDKS